MKYDIDWEYADLFQFDLATSFPLCKLHLQTSMKGFCLNTSSVKALNTSKDS